jgi:hypothetical protein
MQEVTVPHPCIANSLGPTSRLHVWWPGRNHALTFTPLPLIIYYPAIPDKISTADEESAILALQQRDRVRRIHVTTLTAVLCNLFKSMDCDFPMLERLSLHLSTETRAGLGLPEKLQAPLLRHLTLSHISLPIQSQLLRQAENLITLRLWNVPPSSEFNPAHLVAQLLRMHHLEVLLVHFYTAISKRRFESPAQPMPITLPSLRVLAFRGGSTYLEGVLSRINAPHLSTLNVELFNQLTFNLGRLLQFIRRSDEFRFRSVEMHFDNEFVSVIVDPNRERGGTHPFLVQVRCQPLGWQATCTLQICHALGPVLAGVQRLTLGFHKDGTMPWQDEIDLEKWHELLRTFAGVQRLRLSGDLVGDLYRFLQLGEGELPLDLLPQLRELVPGTPEVPALPYEEHLPRGWESRIDPHGRKYFVDHNTRTNSWNPPIHPDSWGPTPRPNLLADHLPRGWESRIDPHGRKYFVDHNTRTSSWNPPIHSVSTPRPSLLADIPTIHAPSMRTDETILSSNTISGDGDHLPQGWESRIDEHGRKYFVDHNTRTTSRNPPPRTNSWNPTPRPNLLADIPLHSCSLCAA